MRTKDQTVEAIDAASAFLAEHFPDCDAALLAGSIVRGEATLTSDLDIVVVTQAVQVPYRTSLLALSAVFLGGPLPVAWGV